jgi:predicted aldo/keto reductase-like oxidoreductase
VDTAYPYHRQTSEPFLGRALQDGYRERVKLATKMPCWLIKAHRDFDRYLDEQLARLQTDHIDFYLLHGLNGTRWPEMRDRKVLDWAEGAIADGRIGHLGFSFHDKYEVFQEIVDATDLWTFCQIQYNYIDVEYQAGIKGLKYAASKGLAVIAMEPIRGGRLANNIPPAVQNIWNHAPTKRTPAEFALQWVWNQPEISLLLSGMSAMEHVEENLASAERSGPGTLTPEELALYDRVREAYQALCPIPCTDCKYCLPCPNGVNIPRVFEIYNDLMMYGDENRAQMVYNWLAEDQRANLCIECGECLDKCPQMIEIPDWLAKAHEALCQEEA